MYFAVLELFVQIKTLQAASLHRSCCFMYFDDEPMTQLKEIPQSVYRYILEDKEAAIPDGCLICGNLPVFIGCLEKTNPNLMLIYCLCSGCYENAESAGIVEKITTYYETARKHHPNILEHRRAS